MKRRWALCVGIAATLFAPAAAAGEVSYEAPPPPPPLPPPPSSPPSSFCAGGLPRKSLTPFRPQPKLHSPGKSGRVGFGPSNLVLEALPPVIEGPGSVGYELTVRPSTPAVHLNWDVTTVLTFIDWRGQPLGKVKGARRHVDTVSPDRAVQIRFAVNGGPAFYRLTSVFRSDSGKKLGGYGFYFRVVPESEGARLVLKANSYRPGGVVIGRVDNLGTEPAFYGMAFAIERQRGPRWLVAPESPDGPWLMPLYATPPGHAGKRCSSFEIPAQMPPGRYRMSKRVNIGFPISLRDDIQLSAEFSVRP